jgi:hypothetical protein
MKGTRRKFMGNKMLSEQEAAKSLEAVKDSLNNKESYFGKANITVENNDNTTFYYKNVGLIISYEKNRFMSLTIEWNDDETQPKNYKKRNLRGYYTTSFCKMYNKQNTLFVQVECSLPVKELVIDYLDLKS